MTLPMITCNILIRNRGKAEAILIPLGSRYLNKLGRYNLTLKRNNRFITRWGVILKKVKMLLGERK
jgi:hypothetical protein